MVRLRSLRSAGLIRVVLPETARARRTLLSQEELFDLLGRLRRSGIAPTYVARPKVAVLVGDSRELRQLVSALTHVTEFCSARDVVVC